VICVAKRKAGGLLRQDQSLDSAGFKVFTNHLGGTAKSLGISLADDPPKYL